MSTLQGDESLAKAKEISARYTSPDEKAFIQQYMENEADVISQDIAKLDHQLERMLAIKKQLNEVRQIIPMKYIAEHYFGKSAAWLSQRVNGTPIRGKIYCLKDAEINTLNHAIQDIGKKLGSLSII